ncbi:hypothetical protein FYL79_09645 [Salmonella enterica subsp. enterica serovar Typhimurium]|nr:hypothetical protein FYL79_09645 [Salmonella enterica subsp. enterica serovar Typhimurium]
MQNITSLFTFYYCAITSSFFVIFFLIFYIKMRIITHQTANSSNPIKVIGKFKKAKLKTGAILIFVNYLGHKHQEDMRL